MAFKSHDTVDRSQKLVKRNPDASAMTTDLSCYTSMLLNARKMARKSSVQAFWPMLLKQLMTEAMSGSRPRFIVDHHLSQVMSDVVMQTAQLSQVRFNVPLNTL